MLAGQLSANATYFQARTRGQINWAYSAPVSAACSGGGYVNIDRTRSQGLEVAMAAQPTDTVDLRAVYTWQEVVDATSGQRIRTQPRHQGTASLGWQFHPDTHASVGLRYRDVTTGYNGDSSAFLTADLRLAHALTDSVTLLGRIENLFERRYEEIRGHGTAGRSAYAGLSARF